MNKVVKDSRGRFMKGVVTNPKGRTKGTLNEATKRYGIIKKLASEKYERAFEILWEAVEAKESWAHQLFFKELVPKKFKEETLLIESHGDTVEEQISTVRRALSQMNELTHDETLQRLKALASVKLNDSLDQQTDEIKETRERLMGKVDIIEEMIEMKKREQEKEEES